MEAQLIENTDQQDLGRGKNGARTEVADGKIKVFYKARVLQATAVVWLTTREMSQRVQMYTFLEYNRCPVDVSAFTKAQYFLQRLH